MSAVPNYQGVCLPDGSGERLNGIQEVSGSIPLISTTRGESRKPWVSFEIHGFFLPSVCLKLGAKRHFRLPVMFFGGERMRAAGN